MKSVATVSQRLASVCSALVVLWTQSAAQAAETGAEPKPNTARITGVVPILRKKGSSAVKDYGPPPAFKVDKPESPRSAVWVGSGASPTNPATATPVRIQQSGFQFRPALAVVRSGTPVVFPNEDQLYHSVFSKSQPRRFDLGRFRKGEEPAAVVMDSPGLVQLFCEVHEHMRANLLVVDTPWFAVTDAEGRFSIEGISPGRHAVSVWLSPKQTLTREVDLAAGQTLEVDWSNLVEEPSK